MILPGDKRPNKIIIFINTRGEPFFEKEKTVIVGFFRVRIQNILAMLYSGIFFIGKFSRQAHKTSERKCKQILKSGNESRKEVGRVPGNGAISLSPALSLSVIIIVSAAVWVRPIFFQRLVLGCEFQIYKLHPGGNKVFN